MAADRFEQLVDEALDQVPDEFARLVDNCVLLVEARHPDEPRLLGLYEGIPLTERDGGYTATVPDVITLYRDAILDICHDEQQARQEVLVTVVHEIAHFFGIDDDRLHQLGWG